MKPVNGNLRQALTHPMRVLAAWWITPDEGDMKLNEETGIIKYGIAWLLGVPVSVLIVIFLLSRAC